MVTNEGKNNVFRPLRAACLALAFLIMLAVTITGAIAFTGGASGFGGSTYIVSQPQDGGWMQVDGNNLGATTPDALSSSYVIELYPGAGSDSTDDGNADSEGSDTGDGSRDVVSVPSGVETCDDIMCPQTVGMSQPKLNPDTGECYCGGSCGDGHCDSYEASSGTCPQDCSGEGSGGGFLPHNTPPVFNHVDFPEGNVSGTVNASWNVTDPDGDRMSADIFVSEDNGTTWEKTGLGDFADANQDLFVHRLVMDTTTIDDGFYMVKANVTDEHGAETVWTSGIVEVRNEGSGDDRAGDDNETDSDGGNETDDGDDTGNNETGNHAPVFDSVGPFSIEENEELDFKVNAEDPDGDHVEITAESLPEGASFRMHRFRWAPDYEQTSEHQAVFRATDGKDESVMNVSITVNDVDEAPVIRSINGKENRPNFSLMFREGELIDLDVDAYDPEGNNITIGFSGAVDEKGEWQTTDRDSGTYAARITVSDGENEITKTVHLDVMGRRIPGVGACFFADSDGDCIMSSTDYQVPRACVVGRDDLRIQGYTCHDLFDMDGDGIVSSGDISVFKSLVMGLHPHVKGAPAGFGTVDAPESATVGEAFNITVKVTDSGEYGGVKTPRAGIGVEFAVEDGQAELYGRRVSRSRNAWKEYTTGGHVAELTGSKQDSDKWGVAAIQVTPQETGTLIIDLGVEGDPFKGVNEFHKQVEVEVSETQDDNHAPVFEDFGPYTVNESEELSFTVNATDPDGDADRDDLDVSAGNLPIGAVFMDNTFNWTPDYDQAGNYTVTFRATDGQEETYKNTSIQVLDMNRAPVFNHVDFPAGNVSGTVNVSWNVTDPDGDHMTAVIEVSEDNGTTWNDTGLGGWADNNQGLFVHELEADTTTIENGQYVVRATVTDEHGAESVWTSETVEVENNKTENQAPVFDPVDDIRVNETEMIWFNVNATDPEGGNVDLTVENAPEGAIFYNRELVSNISDMFSGMIPEESWDEVYGMFIWIPQYGQAGNYTVTFTASDGEVNSSMDVGIEVLEVPEDQRFNVTLEADPEHGEEPLDVNLTCSVENAEAPYMYTLRVYNGNGSERDMAYGYTENESHTFNMTLEEGNWTGVCQVIDSVERYVNSNEADVMVTEAENSTGNETENHAPVIELDYPENPLSGTVHLNWSITDLEGDNFDWSAEFSQDSMSAWEMADTSSLPNSGIYNLNTTEIDDGEYWVRLNATDEHGAGASELYLLNISSEDDCSGDDSDGDDDGDNDDNDGGGDDDSDSSDSGSGDDDDDDGGGGHSTSSGEWMVDNPNNRDDGEDDEGDEAGILHDGDEDESGHDSGDEDENIQQGTGMEGLTGDAVNEDNDEDDEGSAGSLTALLIMGFGILGLLLTGFWKLHTRGSESAAEEMF
ncbi:MAG: putative Ig domain-containing protein [Candidatus Woesearchaeota archaeon]